MPPGNYIARNATIILFVSKSNPPDNAEEPSKRPHLDPDLSPEPSIADLLVPTTMSDHLICTVALWEIHDVRKRLSDLSVLP